MMTKAKIGSLKVNARYVFLALLTFSPFSNAEVIYRCIGDDGVAFFTQKIISGKECKPISVHKSTDSTSAQWINYPEGSFGNTSNPVSMSFRIRDNTNPLWPSVWTKSTFINANKPKDIETTLSLWNIDCSGNKIAYVQGQTYFKDGTSISSGPINYPTYRYPVPETSDESVISIACK